MPYHRPKLPVDRSAAYPYAPPFSLLFGEPSLPIAEGLFRWQMPDARIRDPWPNTRRLRRVRRSAIAAMIEAFRETTPQRAGISPQLALKSAQLFASLTGGLGEGGAVLMPDQLQLTAVKTLQAGAVRHAEHGHCRHVVREDTHHRVLAFVVKCGGRLVEEAPVRLVQNMRAKPTRCCSPPDNTRSHCSSSLSSRSTSCPR